MEQQGATAQDIQQLMIRSYTRYQRGEISEVTAYRENAILANILKAIDATETQERLKKIEETISLTRNI